MTQLKPLVLVPALLLAACGGDKQTMNATTPAGSVVYSYPADGQTGVSPKSDIVIRLSAPVADDETTLEDQIQVRGAGNPVAFNATLVDGGRSLKLHPQQPLATGTEYSVTFSEPLRAQGAGAIPTPNATGDDGIQFTTRGAYSGIAGLDDLSETFSVADMVPSPDGLLQAMDFSTFRLLLTQPVNPRWHDMGGTIELSDANGNPVPATVLVDQRRISVDPCLTEDPTECGSKDDQLQAGQTYTLKIRNLPSLTHPDQTLTLTQPFTVRETGPTVVVRQDVIDDGATSILNGQTINAVTLNSVLQGTAGPSQQSGSLYAELGYAPSFKADEALPLRVPKNSILNSTSLDVKINGSVPVINPATGQIQQTGNIKVTLLTDASGYLLPNPYTDDLNAPRNVKLFMDVSMNTAEAQPNASLSQNLMGVELDGIALVKDGVLTIDAIGIVEPNLLGQEITDSTIAFHLEARTDVDSALDADAQRPLDTTGPSLVSWMPGPADAFPSTRQSMQRPGDPVVLNFDEPIDAETLADGVKLYDKTDPNTPISIRSYVDGTTVVINPVGGLKHGVDYALSITSALADPAGNRVSSQTLEFALAAISSDDSKEASPIATSTYPGFPCVTRGVDLEATPPSHGFCADKPSENGVTRPDGQPAELLPVTKLPADRPIVVVFSQSMNLASINAETFVVEQAVDASTPSGGWKPVPGRIEKNNQRIRFYPEHPWNADGNNLYRYTLKSQQDGVCDPNDSAPPFICGDNGLALQTDALVDPTDVGGEDMTINFFGAPSLDTVYTPLRNFPTRDVNANFAIEAEEPADFPTESEIGADQSVIDGGLSPQANAAKLATAGNPYIITSEGQSRIGCPVSQAEDCPTDKFIYQTGALNTEVIGPVDSNDPSKGVRVLLYPTMLVATSIDVYLDGDAFADLVVNPNDPQRTGPQLLRMRYAEDPGCAGDPGCPRNSPIPGVIKEGSDGKPVFTTSADLLLDAPSLTLPLGSVLAHNLYSYPVTLDLQGQIVFFDDGRMQIEQRNHNAPPLTVAVKIENSALNTSVNFLNCLGGLFSFDFSQCQALADPNSSEGAVVIPLKIPKNGVYLNFISNPIKELPAEQ